MNKRDRAPLPATRPPLERMLRIHQQVQSGKFPNASTLARELEVSTKSIHRDVEFMRDRLGLPLEYDGRRFGYFYTEEVKSFPTLQITEGELIALLVAEKALQQYRGTSFERPIVSALKKMASSLPDTISLNLAEWDQSISFRTSAEPVLDIETFDALTRAAARHEQLVIHYRKPGRKPSRPEPSIPTTWPTLMVNGFYSGSTIFATTSAPSHQPGSSGWNRRAPSLKRSKTSRCRNDSVRVSECIPAQASMTSKSGSVDSSQTTFGKKNGTPPNA